jgi:hypothetical protein
VGGAKRIVERTNPRIIRIVALGVPTERVSSQWYFQRWATPLPAAGEIVLFDRSWGPAKSLPAQSVLEVPPALAQPTAGLICAALTGLTAIARQSADRLLEPPLGLLARAFRSLLASASGHLGLLDQLLALGGFPAEHVQW